MTTKWFSTSRSSKIMPSFFLWRRDAVRRSSVGRSRFPFGRDRPKRAGAGGTTVEHDIQVYLPEVGGRPRLRRTKPGRRAKVAPARSTWARLLSRMKRLSRK
jgi:hypothetical protein